MGTSAAQGPLIPFYSMLVCKAHACQPFPLSPIRTRVDEKHVHFFDEVLCSGGGWCPQRAGHLPDGKSPTGIHHCRLELPQQHSAARTGLNDEYCRSARLPYAMQGIAFSTLQSDFLSFVLLSAWRRAGVVSWAGSHVP